MHLQGSAQRASSTLQPAAPPSAAQPKVTWFLGSTRPLPMASPVRLKVGGLALDALGGSLRV